MTRCPRRRRASALLLAAVGLIASACASGGGGEAVSGGASVPDPAAFHNVPAVFEPVALPVYDGAEWISQTDALKCAGRQPEEPATDDGSGDHGDISVGLSSALNAEEFLGWVSYGPQALVDPEDLERDSVTSVVFSSDLLSGGVVRGGDETVTDVRVRVDPDLLATAVADSGRGAIVHLLIARDEVYAAASERPDGSWVLIAPCRDAEFEIFLRPWMEELGAADFGQLAQRLVAEPALIAGYEDFAFGRDWYGTSWSETDPEDRYIVDAPTDVLAGLERVTISLEIPEPWQSLDGGLCTKNSVGWNTCVELDNANVLDADGYVGLAAMVVPGEDLSIQLIGPRGNDVKYGELGVVAYTAFGGGAVPRVVARPGASRASTVEALAALAERRPVMEVAG